MLALLFEGLLVMIALFYGIMALSQMLLPLFYSWPRAIRLERNGIVVRRIPRTAFIVAPIVWGAITYGIYWLVNNYWPDYTLNYFLGLGIAFFKIILHASTPAGKKDMAEDFNSSWADHM